MNPNIVWRLSEIDEMKVDVLSSSFSSIHTKIDI